jgi:hypothetical protein
VIENYLFRWRIPGARPTVKSIVDPRRVEWCDNPHYFWYRDEALAVDELKRPITGPEFAFTESPSWSLLQVNHYWTKSEEEFSEKLADPRGDTGTLRPAIAAQPGDSRDDTILMYLPALKAALAADQTRTKQSRTRP